MSENVQWQTGGVQHLDRSGVTGGIGVTVWLTGLPGSGKSTIAFAAEKTLVSAGRAAYVLDGDNLRHGLNADLGFSAGDRSENVRRVGHVARLMADAGLVVLVPVIAPYSADRAAVADAHRDAGVGFLEVLVDAPLSVCEQRDPKGLYAKARSGEITGMTGIDDPYESPQSPDLKIDTVELTIEESVAGLVKLVASVG